MPGHGVETQSQRGKGLGDSKLGRTRKVFARSIAAWLLVASCQKEDRAGLDPDPNADLVTRVELDPDSASIALGDSARFTAIARRADGSAVSTAIALTATGG